MLKYKLLKYLRVPQPYCQRVNKTFGILECLPNYNFSANHKDNENDQENKNHPDNKHEGN